MVRLPSRRRALNRPTNRCGTPSSVLPPRRRPCALPRCVPRPAPPFLEVCSWCCASISRSPRARHQVEPIRRRALPFKAEGGLDPSHARAAGGGRGAGAFHAHIAAHTAPTRRAARAPKASQPWGQTLNGTVRTMLGAGAGGALGLCRACTHGLGTPLGRGATTFSGAARAQPPVPPLHRRTIRKRTPPDWRSAWPRVRRSTDRGRLCGWTLSRRAACPPRRSNCAHAAHHARAAHPPPLRTDAKWNSAHLCRWVPAVRWGCAVRVRTD